MDSATVFSDSGGGLVNDVTEHLLRRAQWTASRSSGPGGQHRDKASTRAELTVTEDDLEGLPDAVRERLSHILGLTDAPLRITRQDERSLARNRQTAIERLRDLVAEALKPPAPPRRPRRPSRAARTRRLDSKTRRATTKRLRQPPADG
ncbi:MAG: alternative ribosome rescue aminoacyl-tRNA hydrolase ArfB [Chloroflexota bacterium]